MVNTMPRANQDVFHALLNGGKLFQKRSGLPRYARCRGSLKMAIMTQPKIPAQNAVTANSSLRPKKRETRKRPVPRAENTSASHTSRPLPSIHSVWAMGLTIHSWVTIH